MQEPDDILFENAETYRKKEADYGASWKLAGQTMALWLRELGEDELRLLAEPESLTSIGLFTRRLDKLIRAFNAEFVADDLNYESLMDTHQDESTYGAMHASLIGDQEEIEYVNVPDSIAEYDRAYQKLRAGSE